MPRAVASLICILLAGELYAQQAHIAGTVTDPAGAVVRNARVELLHAATHARFGVQTNGEGVYLAAAVPPGEYKLSVTATGFDTSTLDRVRVEVGAKLTLDFVLRIGSGFQVVDVEAVPAQVNTVDASISAVVDQGFVRNIPLNGRSFQSLLTLIPGVVAVPSSGSSGQISVNGMRAEQNGFQVDGVSGNTGVNTASPGRGAGYSGSVPNATALGTTHSLVSTDALQEFRGTTSTYSAEYGRVPGGQFSFTTRSGTNEFHGSLFEYFRNDILDANSFFNNRAGLPRTKMRQNNFGGTLGGPVLLPGLYNGKERTFFFYSAEALRLRAPQQATITSVPTLALRNELAPVELRRILQAFPLPSAGYAEEAGFTAPFVSSYSQPSAINSHGLRLDHIVTGNFRLFGRVSWVPSSTSSRYAGNMAQITAAEVNSKALTLGATNILSARSTNDARFNITSTDQLTQVTIDDFGGATPLRISDLDGLTETDWALFSYRVNTFPGFWLNPMNNRQRQFNLVDTWTLVAGRHTLKAGADYRQTRTDSTLPRFYQTPFYYNAQQLLNNRPQLYAAYRSAGDMAPVYKNLSLFVQDEWAVTSRLRLSLGLRWEVSPAPRDAGGNQPFTVDQLADLSTTRIAPKGTRLWRTRWNNFGPRLGAAYQLRDSGSYQTALRAGVGLFHDTSTVQASEGYWYGVGITGSVNLNNRPFPLTAAELDGIPAPTPVLTPSASSNVFGFDPHLKLPYAVQWNGTVEQQLGPAQLLSLSYVGSAGRRLFIARQFFPDRLNNPNFPAGAAYLYATTNGAASSYHGFQAQFRRHYSHGLQLLSSYTWSHAIDDASSNFTLNTQQRASANFDVRHNFQTALSWDLPGSYGNRFARALFDGWGLDGRISLRTAMPVDIVASNQVNAGGVQFSPHPNLVPGQPLYIHIENAPGHRVINPAAFSLPPAGAEGNAGRNVARGFGSSQTDLALRREFIVTERIRTTLRAEAFNLFNQVNFGAINTNLQTATAARPFGWATGTQAAQLGGMNPLYQVGGPRSLQLALRVQF